MLTWPTSAKMVYWYSNFVIVLSLLNVCATDEGNRQTRIESSHWESWMLWLPCSVTCGVGELYRYRNCIVPSASAPKCPGNSIEMQQCDTLVVCPFAYWEAWTSWSQCLVTCGEGAQFRSRTCTTITESTQRCQGNSIDMQKCDNNVLCQGNGSWGGWNSWSSCSVTCGSGNMTRTRSCDNPVPASGGKTCEGSATESTSCPIKTSCPVNGSWGNWSAWSSCSVTCGSGNRTRTRSCDNPVPANGGKTCEGTATESTSCSNETMCAVDGSWSNWSNWSSCSVTCGPGNMTRTRLCNNPVPVNGGTPCDGNATESRRCSNETMCAVNGSWGNWSAWSSCSVTCGSGNRTRTRSCDNPVPANGGKTCEGTATESTSCSNGTMCAVDGSWSNWSNWSSCSVTCGPGNMTRTRLCNNPVPVNGGTPCDGNATESRRCSNETMCVVNGSWGNWSAWSSCSVTCGSGNRTRTRSCDNPVPANGGKTCEGTATESTSCSNGTMCAVDGSWSNWSNWSSCSVTCGPGNMTRTRLCNNPVPVNGGTPCDGNATESRRCSNETMCVVNGSWGNWSAWSSCSVTCGSGNRTRTRSCDNPVPANGGKTCEGTATESTSCSNGTMCAELTLTVAQWEAWTPWSQCSVTCSEGEQFRHRICTKSTESSQQCQGNSIDTQKCDTNVLCQGDGSWGSWNSWSSCSVTCGSGNMTRTRFCDNPVPASGGKTCEGSATESTSCPIKTSCPVNGSWGNWSSWSSCSVTCGSGNITRTRSCDNPVPSNGGKTCEGTATESTSCSNETICAVDGSWSNWSNWSSCSVTCGPGNMTRTRLCNNPVPVNGGTPCDGNATESRRCSNETMCAGNPTILSVTSSPPSPVDGNKVILSCNATGNPTPEVRWTYRTDLGFNFVPPTIHYSPNKTQVTIDAYTSTTYGGNWTCFAINSAGTVSLGVHI